MVQQTRIATLADKLALLPTDRHVTIHTRGDSPTLFASWGMRRGTMTISLGLDTDGSIAAWIMAQDEREKARQKRRMAHLPPPSECTHLATCADGHAAPVLGCHACTDRAIAQVHHKKREEEAS
jgi:hypothetical protein